MVAAYRCRRFRGAWRHFARPSGALSFDHSLGLLSILNTKTKSLIGSVTTTVEQT